MNQQNSVQNHNVPQNNDLEGLDLRDYNFDDLSILSEKEQKRLLGNRFTLYDKIMGILRENK